MSRYLRYLRIAFSAVVPSVVVSSVVPSVGVPSVVVPSVMDPSSGARLIAAHKIEYGSQNFLLRYYAVAVLIEV